MEIQVRNVNHAYKRMLRELHGSGQLEDTRNGPAFVFPEPVLTIYNHPNERVLWDPTRNANPIFHLMEALWMLAGRNDVHFLQLFNHRMVNYSDDGKTLYGAYGYRWHYFFGVDQLDRIVHSLLENPGNRRLVLSMWSSKDLGWNSKDIPCNTHIYFKVNKGLLDMTVCNRSNDMVWGAYGTNYVHFSFLQEYIATCASLGMGRLLHFSNNFHAYAGVFSDLYANLHDYADPYEDPPYFVPESLVIDPPMFLPELREVLCWIEDYAIGEAAGMYKLKNTFLYNVILMAKVWIKRKELTINEMLRWLAPMTALDWRCATISYITRNCKLKEA